MSSVDQGSVASALEGRYRQFNVLNEGMHEVILMRTCITDLGEHPDTKELTVHGEQYIGWRSCYFAGLAVRPADLQTLKRGS